jgi:chemosensory pili system protein ChpA (sensor histidine kinase/response regulator)
MRRDALADMPVVDPLIPPESAREFDMSLATDEADAGFSAALDEPIDVAAPMAVHDGHVGDTVSASSVAAAPLSPDADAMLLTQWTTKDALPAGAPESDAAEPATVVAAEHAHAAPVAQTPSPEPFVEFAPLADHLDQATEPEPAPIEPAAEVLPPKRGARAGMAAAPWSSRRPQRVRLPTSRCSTSRTISTRRSCDLPRRGQRAPSAGERGGQDWRRAPRHDDAAQLRRTLHTLKGSRGWPARCAWASLRTGWNRGCRSATPVAPSAELFEALDTDVDRLAFVLAALRDGKGSVPLPWLAQPAPADAPASATATAAQPAAHAGWAPASVAAAPLASTSRDSADVETAKAMLRVRADIVDQLVNEAGEVAIARARVEGELRTLKANLLELTGIVIRLRGQVREIELQAETQIQSRMSLVQSAQEDFDPLELDRYTRFQELTRSFAEGVNDVSTVQQALLKNLDDADAALIAQARLSRDVQQRLFAIRTVPFNSLSERLYRILRKTARELDKRANLEIHGAQTELDRSVLEKLVRSARAPAAMRSTTASNRAARRGGQSRTGEIELTVRQIGNEIATVHDDGPASTSSGCASGPSHWASSPPTASRRSTSWSSACSIPASRRRRK